MKKNTNKMKKLLLKLWSWIMKKLKKLDDKVDKLLPIASNFVQFVKKAIEHKDFDMITTGLKKLIPGTSDDFVIDEIVSLARIYIPKIALQLEIVTTISDVDDPREQLIAIFEKLENVSGEKWEKFCSQLGQQVLYDMSDGIITWGEAGVYLELYYKNYIQKQY